MDSLIQQSLHDVHNRTMALTYINGELYIDKIHSISVNKYLNSTKHIVRPNENELLDIDCYIFGHILSHEKLVNNIKYNRCDFDKYNWELLTNNLKENEVAIFLELKNSKNIAINDIVNKLKFILKSKGYINLKFYNEDYVTIDCCFDKQQNKIYYEKYFEIFT